MLSMLPIIANCLKDDHYVDKQTPIYHISKEVIRPYYLGWIIKKKTLWRNIINDHILRIKEVSKKKALRTCSCVLWIFERHTSWKVAVSKQLAKQLPSSFPSN